MKKPKTTPAPTPLELAQHIIDAREREIETYRAWAAGRGTDASHDLYLVWDVAHSAYRSALYLFGPQVATAYVSLHAHNADLAGTPFGKQLTEVEAERDALRLATMLNDDMAWARKCIKLYTAAIPTCFPDPAEVLAWFCSLADENAQLRERVEALEKALESAGLVEADICPHCQWPNPHPVATHCEACDSPLPTAPTEKGGEAE